MATTLTPTDATLLALTRSALSDGSARFLRLGAGLSLQEVADAIGTSPGVVCRWESKQRRPSRELGLRYGCLLSLLQESLQVTPETGQ